MSTSVFFRDHQEQIEENFEDEGSFTDFPEFLTLVSKVTKKKNCVLFLFYVYFLSFRPSQSQNQRRDYWRHSEFLIKQMMDLSRLDIGNLF